MSSVNNINIQLKDVNLILNNNYIIAEVIIKVEDVNKDIRILNYHEEYLRTNPFSFLKDKIYNNEEEIKKCEVHINNELIPFNYFHKFKTKGKYIINIFKNN